MGTEWRKAEDFEQPASQVQMCETCGHQRTKHPHDGICWASIDFDRKPVRCRCGKFEIREAKFSPAGQHRATPPAQVADDQNSIEQRVKDCDQRVYRLALRITRSERDAEDARQETMLKAYRHIDQFEGRARFTTWISRIAINEALMNLRSRNDGRHVRLEDVAKESEDVLMLRQFRPPAEDPEMQFRCLELSAVLDEAINGLRPFYRDVFILRALDGCSTSETAKSLGLTVNAVKTRLRRARIELRGHLATDVSITSRLK